MSNVRAAWKNNSKMAGVLAFCLALSLILVPPKTAQAVETVSIDTPAGFISHKDSGDTGSIGGTLVYFGSVDGTPLAWHIVDTGETGKATLWTTTSVAPPRAYDPTGYHNSWVGSDICAWLNATGSYSSDGFLANSFSLGEQDAIVDEYSTVAESGGLGPSFTPNQKIVLPSTGEMGTNEDNNGAWKIDRLARSVGAAWWLRTPGMNSGIAANVNSGGSVYGYGLDVKGKMEVHPALKLNLDSVAFTSAASGAYTKAQAVVGEGFAQVATPDPADPVKLTVKSADLVLADASIDKSTVKPGKTIKVSFDGAATGTNRYVSCVLIDGSNNIRHYAKLSDASSGTDVPLDLPAGLADGGYTLRLFNEEANADYLTDYTSEPIDIPLTIDSTIQPTVVSVSPSGTDVSTAGDVTITFDDSMEEGVPGTVSLNGSALEAGTWSESAPGAGFDTYTAPYDSLAPNTTYGISIEGFADTAGNVMVPDASHSFVTAVPPFFECWFEGSNVYTKGSNVALVFVADKDCTLFTNAEMDGVTASAPDVTISSGSTKAALSPAYLETLSVGTHTIELFFSDGTSGRGVYNVVAGQVPVSLPGGGDINTLAPTGDALPVIPIAGVVTICALLAVAAQCRRARQT